MDGSRIDGADVLFLESLLIFCGLFALSILSTFFVPGHIKVNTTFKGYTDQLVVLRTKLETFFSSHAAAR